jgi:hypothetical protein
LIFFSQNTLNSDSRELSTVILAKSCWNPVRSSRNLVKSNEPSSPTPRIQPKSSSPTSLGLSEIQKKKKNQISPEFSGILPDSDEISSESPLSVFWEKQIIVEGILVKSALIERN